VVQEKGQLNKQPTAMPEVAKADSKPAAAVVESKSVSAPAARTGSKP
jgi:hypothetical protein